MGLPSKDERTNITRPPTEAASLGFKLWIAFLVATLIWQEVDFLVAGKIKMIGGKDIFRHEHPVTFWLMIGSAALTATVMLVIIVSFG